MMKCLFSFDFDKGSATRLQGWDGPGKKTRWLKLKPPDFFASVRESREPPTTDFAALARVQKIFRTDRVSS
jgi:hypothetical protein